MDKISKNIIRLYVKFTPNAEVTLTKEQMHHLSVRRFNEKRHSLVLFCEEYGDWTCEWTQKNIVRPITQYKEPCPLLKRHFAFGIPKSQTLAFLIEKGVELGISDFYPLQTDHSQTYTLNEKRFSHIMIDALEQCERHHLPRIHPVTSLTDFLALDTAAHTLCAMERMEGSFSVTTQDLFAKASGILIGPEGGWSDREKQCLTKKTTIFSLGTSILRTETAAIVSLGLLEVFS
jgi:16S rRNA (uracil1498-N3)-methyltransferase